MLLPEIFPLMFEMDYQESGIYSNLKNRTGKTRNLTHLIGLLPFAFFVILLLQGTNGVQC